MTTTAQKPQINTRPAPSTKTVLYLLDLARGTRYARRQFQPARVLLPVGDWSGADRYAIERRGRFLLTGAAPASCHSPVDAVGQGAIFHSLAKSPFLVLSVIGRGVCPMRLIPFDVRMVIRFGDSLMPLAVQSWDVRRADGIGLIYENPNRRPIPTVPDLPSKGHDWLNLYCCAACNGAGVVLVDRSKELPF